MRRHGHDPWVCDELNEVGIVVLKGTYRHDVQYIPCNLWLRAGMRVCLKLVVLRIRYEAHDGADTGDAPTHPTSSDCILSTLSQAFLSTLHQLCEFRLTAHRPCKYGQP
jgi:hypothetical protein